MSISTVIGPQFVTRATGAADHLTNTLGPQPCQFPGRRATAEAKGSDQFPRRGRTCALQITNELPLDRIANQIYPIDARRHGR